IMLLMILLSILIRLLFHVLVGMGLYVICYVGVVVRLSQIALPFTAEMDDNGFINHHPVDNSYPEDDELNPSRKALASYNHLSAFLAKKILLFLDKDALDIVEMRAIMPISEAMKATAETEVTEEDDKLGYVDEKDGFLEAFSNVYIWAV
ncbi:hypothetical protein ACJX0J_007026, partial [Zea mays]